MYKHSTYLGQEIKYEPFLWGGAFIVFMPKGDGTQTVVMHRFKTEDECKSFIDDNREDTTIDDWVRRTYG